MRNLFTFIIALFSITAMYAQFTLNGEIRPRTEFLHGYKAPTIQNTTATILTSQRTRLGFGYVADKFDVGIQIQDVRAWGSERQLVVNDGYHTTIHQAWAKIKFNSVLALKVGRQELVYDDSRILGNVGWAQQARSHDLALLTYEKKDVFKLHFGFALNTMQPHNYAVANNYKSMHYLWFNKNFGDHYKLSILMLNNGVQDTIISGSDVGKDATTFSQIIGQHSVISIDKFIIGLNTYYQGGYDKGVYQNDAGDTLQRKISGYDIGIDIKYKINDNFNVGGGFEMLSGHSETNKTKSYAEKNHAFTPLYGTNHKFNGWMDYFYVGNHINTVGLNDFYININYKKNKIFTGAAFHYFMANAPVYDAVASAKSGNTEAMSSGLGMELDTYFGYKLSKDVLFKFGISGMFDTETMRVIKGGDYGASNYWGWAMIVVKPTFFKSDKK